MPSPFLNEFRPPSASLRPQGTGLFVGSIVFALAVAGAWASLKFYDRSLEAQISSVKEEIKDLEKNINTFQLRELLRVSDVIKASRSRLEEHLAISRIFEFLESKTHPRLRFKDFAFDHTRRIAALAGETLDYRTLAEQITALEEVQEVTAVEFGDLVFANNRLSFSLKITFSKDLILFR